MFSFLQKYFFQFSFSRLQNLYSSVLSDMNKDFENNDIMPEEIFQISLSVDNFIKELEKIQKNLQKLSLDDKKEFSEICKNFYEDLILWKKRHASELGFLQEKINKEKEKNSVKVFDDAIARLEILKNL